MKGTKIEFTLAKENLIDGKYICEGLEGETDTEKKLINDLIELHESYKTKTWKNYGDGFIMLIDKSKKEDPFVTCSIAGKTLLSNDKKIHIQAIFISSNYDLEEDAK